MKTRHLLIACSVTIGVPMVAMAQDEVPRAPMTPEEIDEPEEDPTPVAPAPTPTIVPIYIDNDDTDEEVVMEPVGPPPLFTGGAAALKVMAGSGDFTQEGAREATGIGPSWDVRAVFGAHSPVGIEAAYIGSTRGLTGESIFDGDQLMSNGTEGSLRVAAPLKVSDFVDVRPFMFGGVGWQYMTIWGEGAFDGAPENDAEGDSILTIPAGLGIELGVGALNVDVRGTYRHAVGSDIFGNADASWDDPDALHSYNISAGLGVEF